MKVKSESEVAQLCPSLSDPMDCSLPGSSVHGILQVRVPEWGAIAFSQKQVYWTPKLMFFLLLLGLLMTCWSKIQVLALGMLRMKLQNEKTVASEQVKD